jgi:SM-20-related protein
MKRLRYLLWKLIMNWEDYWQKYFDDHDDVLDDLVNQGFTVINDALPIYLYTQLFAESQDTAHFKAAKIIAGGRLDTIRSDSTRWIDDHDSAGIQYLSVLKGLGQVLNQSLFLGVRSVEAHYAEYQIGQFYAEHRDNAKGSNIRAISTVLYLNGDLNTTQSDTLKTQETWQTEWGGELRLSDSQNIAHHILPTANRLVVFQSDLPHEVLPANKIRRSIAGWLRRDD